MAALSRADAVWEGDLPTGKGRVKVASGTFNEFPVTWASRAERSHGTTSPEELLAAAHAAWAAASSSSGLVVPCDRSARLAHVTGNSLNVPLATLTRPLPVGRSPSQTASARLKAAMCPPPK